MLIWRVEHAGKFRDDPVAFFGQCRAVITEQGWQLEAYDLTALDISITGSGTGSVEATVEWTFATNDVDLYVTATTCTAGQVEFDLCAYKAKADSATGKPERVSFSVSPGENWRFWIVNFGPQRESGTFQAVLTR